LCNRVYLYIRSKQNLYYHSISILWAVKSSTVTLTAVKTIILATYHVSNAPIYILPRSKLLITGKCVPSINLLLLSSNLVHCLFLFSVEPTYHIVQVPMISDWSMIVIAIVHPGSWAQFCSIMLLNGGASGINYCLFNFSILQVHFLNILLDLHDPPSQSLVHLFITGFDFNVHILLDHSGLPDIFLNMSSLFF